MKITSLMIITLILFTGCGVNTDSDGNLQVDTPIKSGVDAFSNTDNSSPPNTTSSPTPNTNASNLVTEKTNALSAHNDERKTLFNNGDLIWSDSLEKSAQSYANTLAKNGLFTHSSLGIGENLYASSASATLKAGVNAWVNERSAYDYASNSCINNRICGHYTQVIWQDTNKVGCAKAKYEVGQYKGWTVVVCHYNPNGNFVGQKPY